jgi:mono/diheme cytochrome c family protein
MLHRAPIDLDEWSDCRQYRVSTLGIRDFAMRLAIVAGTFVGVLCMNGVVWAKAKDEVARGRYLAMIGNCGVCHSPRDAANKPVPDTLSGGPLGRKQRGVGVFWAPNLTNDEETGLGAWSDQDIIQAFRKGVRPDGRELSPVMPTEAYVILTDADAKAIVAYLRSLKPVNNKVPDPVGVGQKSPTPYYGVMPAGEVKE